MFRLFYNKTALLNFSKFRSSHRRCSAKKGVLKNFCKFHRKTPMLESLFDKFAGLNDCNLIRKRLQHRCFPKAPFLRIIWKRLLLKICKLNSSAGISLWICQTLFRIVILQSTSNLCDHSVCMCPEKIVTEVWSSGNYMKTNQKTNIGHISSHNE